MPSLRSMTGQVGNVRYLAFGVAIACGFVVGCGSQHATPVDATRAREALRTALDGWKKGEAPSTLQTGTPPITVQDLDWLAGARLVEYQVDGDGRPVEANLYVPVKLTLRTQQGRVVKKTVNYVVGTSPILTVFRDFH